MPRIEYDPDDIPGRSRCCGSTVLSRRCAACGAEVEIDERPEDE